MEKNFYFSREERSGDYGDFNYRFYHSGNFARHTHVDYYEIIIPTGETFINTVGGADFPTGKREVLIIPPGISHTIRTVGSGNAPHHNLAVKKERLAGFIRSKKHLSTSLSGDAPYLIPLDDASFTLISGLFESVDNESYDEKFLLVAQTVLHLIACASLIHSENEGYAENTVTAYCKDVIAKIDGCALMSANVADIYRSYPVSHSTLCKEFHRLTGKTPRDYLSEKKMEYAASLVLTTSLSILEISEMLGFESGSHFIRKFSKQYGVSPLKYRKGRRTNNTIKEE